MQSNRSIKFNIYKNSRIWLGKQSRNRTECNDFISNSYNGSADFELRYFHCSDSHNSFFILQIILAVYHIVHKKATVCTFKYLRRRIHVFLLIFTQFVVLHYKYIIDSLNKNCIKYYQQGHIETLYVPERFNINKTNNEYFVVSSGVLRQLPDIYGGRYGGPVGCEVGENQ